jgi:hypothetical protein
MIQEKSNGRPELQFAKVDSDYTIREIIGKNGLSKVNTNRELLADYCTLDKVKTVLSTSMPQSYRVYTDHRTEYQVYVQTCKNCSCMAVKQEGKK